jgi:hypothetical protein
MALKPLDVYVILKILSLKSERWNYEKLAKSLLMSSSEAHAAVKRGLHSGLIREALGEETNQRPVAGALVEFLVHGIRYAFPPDRGPMVRGVPTGFAAPGLENLVTSTDEPFYVWPSPHGEMRGQSFSPLFRRAPEAVREAPRFHQYLGLTDILRQPSPRQREIADSQIRRMIGEDS